MTKYLPDQSRIERSFPVVINGVLTQLTEGTNFTDSASLLSALDGAGITYSAQKYDATTGTASGRIRINGTGSIVTVGVNGTFTSFAVNDWFTPTAAQLEALQRAGNLVLEAEYATAVLTAGNELWVQPGFDASTSITLNGWSITGGEAISPASSATMTATAIETLTTGQYQVIMDVSGSAAQFRIRIAGTTFTASPFTGTGSQTKTVTVASVTDQLIGVSEGLNDGGYKITALSVKKLS